MVSFMLCIFYHSIERLACNKYLKAAFAEKHWLLAWTHTFIESSRKAWHPSLQFCICVLCSDAYSPAVALQPSGNPGRTRTEDNHPVTEHKAPMLGSSDTYCLNNEAPTTSGQHQWPPEHTCDWDCLIIMHYTHPPFFLLCLNLQQVSVGRWIGRLPCFFLSRPHHVN
jgi:hypothetical protein